MQVALHTDNRLELYRILSEPVRLRLLAVAAAEELAIGELADLLGESQPTVSRQVAPLRRLGLLAERRQGTRVLVRLDPGAASDPVIADALQAGRALCEPDQLLERIADIVRRRDAPAREFFTRAAPGDEASFPSELPSYLRAVSVAGPHHTLAVEVGTGDGRFLEALAPSYDRVVALDREPAQLERAAERLRRRGYENVELLRGDLEDDGLAAEVASRGRPDAVFASRVLHHAPRPADAVRRMATLAAPGGAVVVLDYAAHADERMRSEQADLWLGFAPDELCGYMGSAGLTGARVTAIASPLRGRGPDAHLPWQLWVARRPVTEVT